MKSVSFSIFIQDTWYLTKKSFNGTMSIKNAEDRKYKEILESSAKQESSDRINKEIGKSLALPKSREEPIIIPPSAWDDHYQKMDLIKKKDRRRQDPYITTSDEEEETLMRSLRTVEEYQVEMRKKGSSASKAMNQAEKTARREVSATITSGQAEAKDKKSDETVPDCVKGKRRSDGEYSSRS